MTPLLERRRGEIEALCRRYYVKRLEVFGSAVRDDFDPAHSDFDFLVVFEERQDVSFFNAYFDLREELIALLGRPVDLVMPGAIRNPVVKADIDAHRELFYAA